MGMRRPASLVLLAAALLAAGACQTASPAPPRIVVDHPSELVDTPADVRFDGLPPGGQVTVEAHALDSAGVTWTSSATFQAGAGGSVDLATAPPRGGSSYAGADPMGLLWSLTPSKSDAGRVVSPPASEDVILTARAAGGQPASRTLVRLTAAAGVTAQPATMAADGLFGIMYSPAPGGARRPAVLVFGGSEGGLATTLEASLLASHGFPALGLAYFAEPGLPPSLQNVPLEYFTRALTWLGHQPDVDPRHVMVMGASRGSEAALLLGVHFPDLVHGVVALVPSSTVHSGLDARGFPAGAAWTLGGQPLSAVLLYESANPAPADDPQAIIPVEGIRGPVLLVAGSDDHLWPSAPFATAITARLDAAHDPYRHQNLVYSGAGHAVGSAVPYVPASPPVVSSRYGNLDLGGSRPVNARALADAWPRLLAFLAAAGTEVAVAPAAAGS
jgi:dienelactone hydrolase